MNIVIGGDQYPEYINGAASFTARLARGLARRGHQVTVIWPSADGTPAGYAEDGVDVVRVRSFALPRSHGLRVVEPRTAGRVAAAVLERVRPDVVHVQSHVLVGRQLCHAAHRDGYPLVATNHFMPENVLDHVPFISGSNTPVSRWSWRDLAAVYGRADLVTAPTPRAVALLATQTGLRAEAISCGIDPDRFSCRGGAGSRTIEPTVLFVGRLETEKRIDELLHAFAGLPAWVPARLHVVGTGTQVRPLRALANRLGVADRVTFAGRVSEAELARAYRGADVFCMPSTAELQSLATLEAMSAGLPVVAARAMALPHLIEDDRNGYLYTPGDVAALTDRLSTLLTQPLRRRRLGQAGIELAQRHAIEHTLDAFEAHYFALAAPRVTRLPTAAVPVLAAA